ncbi:Pyruvate/Phosphoenolpyruvate kinase-like domain-containing protein [Mrakia frigida]|uniref:HpcH/HpaI aldolase family protein n=1 Tax=Mrakia frigida TaxID=29902 RepID=UPI003FCC1D1A
MYGIKSVIPAAAKPINRGLLTAFDRWKTEGKGVYGNWMMFPGAGLARYIASFGYDWILVDCEHGNISDSEMHAMVGAIAGTGTCSPIVRIPAPEPWMIKRALDSGAHGIMVPMIDTVEQAKLVVAGAKFPTNSKFPNSFNGFRGAGSPIAPMIYGQSLPDYIETSNERTVIMLQIETVLGVQNVNEIAAVEGVDMLFIGPNDLSLALGFPPSIPHATNPKVQEVIAEILAATLKAGKLPGIFCTNAEEAIMRIQQGFACANVGADCIGLAVWMGGEMSKCAAAPLKPPTPAFYGA